MAVSRSLFATGLGIGELCLGLKIFIIGLEELCKNYELATSSYSQIRSGLGLPENPMTLREKSEAVVDEYIINYHQRKARILSGLGLIGASIGTAMFYHAAQNLDSDEPISTAIKWIGTISAIGCAAATYIKPR